jgi:glutamine amidotransferase
MQLLFDYSQENDTTCLGVISGAVNKFSVERKVPQIGWNMVIPQSTNVLSRKLFEGIPDGSEFYFVNSYFPAPTEIQVCAAKTTYGETFTSVLAVGNIVATQFHPEKSGDVGLQFIKNFMKECI